jgi:acyl-coenzyme A thioesterase PaaI-like protein
MPVTTDTPQQRLDRTRQAVHRHCIACGGDGHAPRLRFRATSEFGVEATFQPSPLYEGYPGMLHGGVIATLLDAAMTNCLFAHGRRAVTADLHIRYRHPVASAEACNLHAWMERSTGPLFILHAELRQANRIQATATGKFMQTRELDLPQTESR